MTRRQLLFSAGAAVGLVPVVGWVGSRGALDPALATKRFPVEKTKDEWKAQLSPEAYRVLREHGTERAFSSSLNDEKREGTFTCAGCGLGLFDHETKFDSGTGWPSFWRPLAGAVGNSVDRSWFRVRNEIHCASCGGHLGHVFPDGPAPTGERYCMNGVAMDFKPKA